RLLDEARALADQGKWPEALAAMERADKLLTAAGREQRPDRLRGLQKDLNLARRLDEIYRQPRPDLTPSRGGERLLPAELSAEEEFFWGREQDARFAREFREFGIDIDSLEPADSALRIARTSVRPALVKALDDWAVLRRRSRGESDPGWKKLVEVARQ